MKPLIYMLALLSVVLASSAAFVSYATPRFARSEFEIVVGDPRRLAAMCETDEVPEPGKAYCRENARTVAAREGEILESFRRGASLRAMAAAAAFWTVLIGLGLTCYVAFKVARKRNKCRVEE